MTATTSFFIFLSGILIALIINNRYQLIGNGEEISVEVNKDEVDLAVCILSARDHFSHRRSIRNTWLQNKRWLQDKRIMAKFVIGMRACIIHPDDRTNQLSCELWKPKLQGDGDIAAFTVKPDTIQDKVPRSATVSRLAIKVLHTVMLKRIGILSQLVSPVQITLYNGVTDEEIATVVFNNKDQGIEYEGYRYQAIQPMILPKGFEGELTTNISEEEFVFEREFQVGVVESNSGGETLMIERMREDRTYFQPSEKSISLLSFMFTLKDMSVLEDHLAGQEKRAKTWSQHVTTEQKGLDQEAADHEDLLLVDIMDIYSNLPNKLMACHHWFHDHVSTKFVMKTDDDCLVDLDKVMMKLSSMTSKDKLWWGQFRDDWLVERHGKWGERIFPSSTYPRFACGSGNVMSADLHNWVTLNTNHLQVYQGEDVSMGIWLSAVGPNYIQDRQWECSKSCSLGAYVLPELTPEELEELWEKRGRCGDPCGDCPG